MKVPTKIYKKVRKTKHESKKTLRKSKQIHRPIINSNPEFIKILFKVRKANRVSKQQYNLQLEIPKSHQISFSTKSRLSLILKVFVTIHNVLAIVV